MPGKMKTRKAVAKRFTVSGSGKVLREKAAHNHRLVPKSKKAKGLAKMKHQVSKGDAKNVLACM
jgi:large subunit ribosomal protein L35